MRVEFIFEEDELRMVLENMKRDILSPLPLELSLVERIELAVFRNFGIELKTEEKNDDCNTGN